MKPKNMTLHQLIDSDPRTGEISINRGRMIVWSVHSIGLLRRDLVSTLGWDRAKGFLMRYGWNAGVHDAKIVQELFVGYSVEELLLAGPAIHTAEGIVTVVPTLLEVDVESDYLLFEGGWENSYEAQEHVRHFGTNTHAVCWTLAGYASGYLSTIMGQPVVTVEPTCRGRGDATCTYHATTVVHANEADLTDFHYYEAVNLSEELDRAHALLEERNRGLSRAHELQSRINRILGKNHSIQEVVRNIGEVLNRSIVLQNGAGRMLAAYWLTPAHEHVWCEVKHLYEKTERMDLISSYPESVENVYCSRRPVVASDIECGMATVLGDRQISSEDELLLERAQEILAIELFHRQLLVRASHQNFEDLFRTLIDDEGQTPGLIEDRCDRLGSALDRLPLIMLVRIHDRSQVQSVIDRLIDLRTEYPPFVYKGDVALVVCQDMRNRHAASTRDFLEYVHTHLTESIKGMRPIIATGQCVKDWSDLSKSYRQAHDIAGFLRVVSADDNSMAPIGSFEQYELALMFIHNTHHSDLLALYHRLIDPLVRENSEHQTQLIVTAFEFLQCNGSYSKAAERLHMSVAGLRYRLDKITELCLIDWSNMNDRVNLWVALTIHFSLHNGF